MWSGDPTFSDCLCMCVMCGLVMLEMKDSILNHNPYFSPSKYLNMKGLKFPNAVLGREF